ncbi:discoidin domain-containing protein [Clostridium sp.]|uniref:discoidin domain-containing protein n=1 Tax=Clostridium sp. TaxID=1506 RepID=UPI001D6607FF|nr:discoidin domain-containing protein [Clostridium sp.]MBS5939703.1 discoidin domain-containing protein [Clostridium sp.]
MRSKRLFRVICLALSFGIVSSLFPKDVFAMDESTRTSGRDYYISSLKGDNSNDGSTEGKAWETLDKLEEVDLQPGDRVLLESGSVFNGFIHLKDVSGTAENPIEITKYGGEEKPIINGNGEGIWYQDYIEPLDNAGHRGKGYVSSTILLYDTDFIKINNLEITNESDDFDYLSEGDKVSQRMDRTGVAGIAKNGGTMESIQLEDLYIHDVDGNIQDKHMNNGGIQMNVLKPDNEAETGIARYQDILIKGCHVKDVSRAGIVVGYTYNHSKFNGAALNDETVKKYGHTNILIEENYVQNSGNDAIVSMYAYQPVVQKNVSDKAGVDMLEYSYWQNFCAAIWPWKTKDAIFQNNEAFDTVGQNNGDGQAWDIDWSDGTIYQYNYSHNNGGGSMLICLNEAYNGVFRYNISQNDLKALITFQGNPLAKIYNNVFYLDGDLTTRVHHPATGNKDSGAGYLANNIFYNTSTGNPNDPWEPSNNKQYTNNIYYGYNSVPSTDKFAITEDPMFVNPGSAPTSTTGKVHDVSAFDGYKLQDGSPAINEGVYVPGSGDKDFFGNAIGLIPDIGIHEKNISDESSVNEIYSNTYAIKEGSIEGVPQKTSVKDFLGNFKYSNGVKLEVFNEGSIVDENSFIKKGYTLKVTFNDGSIKEYEIIVNREFVEYSIDGMTADDGSHQSGNSTEGPGSFAIDNNLSTMWHTDWNGAKREDTWISIDMGKVQPISMLKYTPRRSIANGIITKYSIYIKENENDQWTKVETENNVWERSIADKYAYFDTIDARYVKLHAEESYSTTSSIYASAAEIRLGVEKNDEEVR